MKNLSRASGDGGFVLIAVLSILALLSGLALAMQLLARGSVMSAEITTAELEIEALIQSGVALAGYQLFVLDMPAERINGQQVRLNQGAVAITVVSEGGKVDINGAGKDLLEAIYRASGLGALSPQDFAARVIDWRDADDDVTEGGAELQAYVAAGLSYSPRNGAFQSLDDLGFVIGVTSADVSALRDSITIFNPDGKLDVYSAPSSLIVALPGVTPAVADQVQAVRRTRTAETAAQLADLLLVQSAYISTEMPASYRVVVVARRKRDDRTTLVELVMTPGILATVPYQILDWRQSRSLAD